MSKRSAMLWGIFLLIYTICSFTIFPRIIGVGLKTLGISYSARKVIQKGTPAPSTKDTQSNAGLGRLIAVVPTVIPMPKSLIPVGLVIPKLNIHANVEQVGQTKSGNIDVPKNAADVAWYVYGAKPGEKGNAIINGHYDTPSGRPAIFYNLKQLEKGDDVQVVSEDGTITDFVVTGKEELPYDTFPAEYVFFKKPGYNLNLITCDGIWNPVQKNYSTRMVVYTSIRSTM